MSDLIRETIAAWLIRIAMRIAPDFCANWLVTFHEQPLATNKNQE